jgi:hypothetical protein
LAKKRKCKIRDEVARLQKRAIARCTLSYKYSEARSECVRRKIQFLLSFDEYKEVATQPCYYCNSDQIYQGTGLDRVDNTMGYIITNVVSCCGTCNQMKSNHHIELFLNKINLIYKNLFDRKDIKK